MKEQLNKVWNKIVENKELAIRIGCAVVGAAIGSVIMAALISGQEQYLVEEITTAIEPASE